MAKMRRITMMDGMTHVLTESEDKRVQQAAAAKEPVINIPRIDQPIVPHQIISYTWVFMPDGTDPLALEDGVTDPIVRSAGHAHKIEASGAVRCSCGLRVRTMLVVRQVDKAEFKRLSGYPGFHFLYEESGMMNVVTTRFACAPAQLPEGMRECSDSEYKRFTQYFAWLQRSPIHA